MAFGLAVLSLMVSTLMPEAWQARRASDDGAGPPGGLRAALRQPDLRPLWLIGGTFSIAITALFVFTRRFVDDTGIGSVGSFFTAYTVAALFLRVFFGWLPDRIGPKRVLLPALLALATGFLWLGQATTDRDVVIGGLLCGIGHGYAFPILFGLVVSRAPEANRGMAMAVFTALFDVGVLVGGPFFGLVIERSGFSQMFVVAAGVTLVGTLIFYRWDGRARVRQAE